MLRQTTSKEDNVAAANKFYQEAAKSLSDASVRRESRISATPVDYSLISNPSSRRPSSQTSRRQSRVSWRDTLPTKQSHLSETNESLGELRDFSKLFRDKQILERRGSVDSYETETNTISAGSSAIQSMRKKSIMHDARINMKMVSVFGDLSTLVESNNVAYTNGIIHPFSPFRWYWDIITLILVLVNVIIIPLALAFGFEVRANSDWRYNMFVIVSDIWFIFDIMLNFRTGYVDTNSDCGIITDTARIRWRYFTHFFVIDFLATMPFQCFYVIGSLFTNQTVSAEMTAPSNHLSMLRFLKIFQMLRLLRVARVTRYIRRLEEAYNFNISEQYTVAIFNCLLWVALLLVWCHMAACFQFALPWMHNPVVNGTQVFSDQFRNSWVYSKGLHNEKYWGKTAYSWAFFRSVSQMLAIGYGNEPPKNVSDAIASCFCMVVGAMLFAVFIGSCTASIQCMDSTKRAFKEEFMQVKQYMQFRKLPLILRERISSYYENRYEGRLFNESKILEMLNPLLRDEVVRFTCSNLVNNVVFFQGMDGEFLSTIITKMTHAVYLPGDCIIRCGSQGDCMYFICKGTVVVRNRQMGLEQRLGEGNHFGEAALFALSDEKVKRTAHVFADTYAYVYRLAKTDLMDCLQEYPEIGRRIREIALQRRESLARSSLFRFIPESTTEESSMDSRVS